MVDPLEAKRLAAKQMQEIQAKEKLIVCETFSLLCNCLNFYALLNSLFLIIAIMP